MTQDINHNTFVKALRAVLVVTLMLLTGSNGLAQTTTQTGVRVNGSVYGGGNLATVGGSVTVNIKAGTIEKDVYGGGALANTNINNATNYGKDNETISSTSTNTTTVNLTGGEIHGDAYGGGLGRLPKEGTAAVYTAVANGTTLTSGNIYYTSEAGAGEFTSDGTEVADGTNYYELTTPGVAAITAVEAKVYGDISVNLGSEEGSTATAFHIYKYTDDAHKDVVKSGRVFGCNNLNGSPLGDVTVTVWKTVAGNTNRSETANKNNPNATYEVAAVYGGGNLANYEPTATGKKTHVIINGCSDTSIKYVYGGGNAAAVPETDVDINAAYELGYVFGGGNGKDQYTLDGTNWINNPGANVNGNANTVLMGGVIHEAFGGSNEKGTISGSVSIDTQSGGSTCALSVGKLYGAGKNADIEGDLIVILGCMPGDDNPTEEVYGGAENANVKGNVELTITSGTFHKVFGGNNTSGAIFGHIKLNIEETGCCPIKIDELYLGGYNAPYSVYGYYEDGTIEGTDKPKYVVRQSASDTHPAVFFGNDDENNHTKAPYDHPELNVISCTRIGKVFGGGLGSGAVIYGNPKVNINQIYGIKSDGNDGYTAKATTLGEIGGQYTLDGETVDGGVFGGGNQAPVIGNTTLNIGTLTEVSPVTTPVGQTANDNSHYNVLGANIVGNVYGGGNLADVTGNTFVYVCAVEGDDPATTDVTEDYTSVSIQGTGSEGVTIGGNVFGGGKGEAAESGETAFTCPKAMVGTNDAGKNDANYSDGNTTIIIGNGTVGTLDTNGKLVEGTGTVYGGGEIGRVEMNTTVTIGLGAGDETVTSTSSAPVILGSVFGGGKGKETHGYAALVRGNPTVTIAGNAKVLKSVYGGGEIASVARYELDNNGEPHALVEINGHYSGYCTVNIGGYAEIGPNGMKMYHEGVTDDKPDDFGHVFGAGKGILPENYTYVDNDHKPYRIGPNNEKEYYSESDYFEFIQTLALSSQTEVTISDHAFVKGSVYGGSENGLVQFDTHVTVSGGQIGAGDEMSVPYRETDWTGSTTPDNGWKECASWVYGLDTDGDNKPDLFAPYDPNANATGDLDKYSSGQSTKGGRRIASDGHTYYGNVFGGGSGSIPYFDTKKGISRYIMSAGQVKGNTYVTISGGHILTNVYGGCEATNVLGVANVTMTDGTIGVPRSDDDIIAHPVTGYLFGGGKGDQRVFFNKDTNVKDAVVTVEGGRIYGSVYGGGEDGHVLRNTTVTIKETDATNHPTKIGTKGTSYYDGHVFGGGRGFGGDALTAGNVGGAVTLSIEGGKILGSVYGGGRLASVGYGLYLTTETGYGIMRADNEYDGSYTNPSTENAEDFFTLGRGHITMTISGGTIGNDDEYNYDADNRLTHTKGGNVFAGGMGRLYKLDGTPNTSVDWRKMGCAKSTKLTISGDAEIKSCVYGGGELGQVVGTHTIKNVANEDVDVSTEIIIQGGTIGTEIKDNGYTQYTFGSVFGGGYGSDVDDITVMIDEEETLTKPKLEAGLVYGDTKVNMSGGAVKASIYGGGEMAGVGVSTTSGETTTVTGSTFVTVSGGSIGIDRIQLSDNTYRYFGGATMGNVYGGGSGLRNIVRSGSILKNATLNISGGTIYHNVYGGGAFGTVGNFTYTEDENTHKVSGMTGIQTGTGDVTVTITGGTIGVDGRENGMVFGSSRGEVGEERDNWMAWVYDTHVTIGDANGGPTIKGSVYGSGENGHTWNDADVIIHNGTIGIHDGTAADATRGNVYGGGCGEDKYDSDNNGSLDMYNPLAGIVYGTTTVTMDGGTVLHNIYGAGALGSVGKPDANGTISSGGKTTIKISGGRIGYDGNDNGNVYGAARGDVGATQTGISQVKETEVYIQYATTPTADNTDKTEQLIAGSVFGGGQAGIVQGNVTVNMNGGLVLQDVYGGGALADTQTSNWDATANNNAGDWATGKTSADNTTTVSLKGGIIGGDAYGGGLGIHDIGKEGDNDYVEGKPAYVYGDVKVELNKGLGDDAKGCVVNRVFGCNNLKGTPRGKVQVYVYATQKNGGSNILDKAEEGTETYDMQAVYGGGNLAPYIPQNALLDYSVDANKSKVEAARSEVYIDGCAYTSIKQVYGGGNAAPAPATYVVVERAYEIDEVFGGGNGADDYSLDENGTTVWYKNPGANVGYYNFATHPKGQGQGTGVESDPYKAVDNSDCDEPEDKEGRLAHQYGSGIATTVIKGGTIHTVYGGSNARGNIRAKLSSTYTGMNDDCPMKIDQTYGSGKNAFSDGVVEVKTDCAKGIEVMFGGAKDADVDNDINLTITNGSSLKKVFGGNNTSGAVNGSITITIKEGGCEPIRIDELYAGGYLAPYSVYGYQKTDGAYDTESVDYIDTDGTTKSHAQRIPLESGTRQYNDPRINVISATYIGKIYGGGYQAKLVGSPHINVNMEKGKVEVSNKGTAEDPVYKDVNGIPYETSSVAPIGEGTAMKYYATLPIGTIGEIYGGGNMADVIGDAYVEIGTGTWVTSWDTNGKEVYEDISPARNAAHITGNVYGGGNLGDIGYLANDNVDDQNSLNHNTHVIICAKEVTENNEPVWKSVAADATDVTIDGDVYGGGKGEAKSFKCEKAMVVGNTTVVIGNGTIGNGTTGGNVFGGGQIGRVEKNTEVMIGLPPAVEGGKSESVIRGNVFGAGAGCETHGYSALVRGNSTVTVQAGAKVEQSVYGGGDIATVGRFWVTGVDYPSALNAPTAPTDLPDEMPYQLRSGGTCRVTVQGNAEVTGDVFGAGKGKEPDGYDYYTKEAFLAIEGHTENDYNINNQMPKRMVDYDNTKHKTTYGENEEVIIWAPYEDDANFVWEYFDTPEKYHTFLQTLALVNEPHVTIGGEATVKESVYGGSKSGFVLGNTNVTTQDDCTIGVNGTTETDGNVFGGGLGLVSFLEAGRVSGNTTVNINGGNVKHNVYGGGKLGYVGKLSISSDYRTFTWKDSDDNDNGTDDTKNTGVCNVTITDGTIGTGATMSSDGTFANGNVFGAGRGKDDTFWCEKAIVYSTNVDISGGTVKGNVYGGGEVGRVETDAVMTIGGGTGSPEIIGNVFGAGAGVKTHGYSALLRGNTYVTVQNSAKVRHNVYGGGQIAAVGKYYLVDAAYKAAHPDSKLEIGMPYSLADENLGVCNVTIKGDAIIGYEGTGDVFGAGKGKVPEYYLGNVESLTDITQMPKRMMSYNPDRYNNNDDNPLKGLWSYSDASEQYVWEYFNTREKYHTFLETLALATRTVVSVEGSSKVNGSVYGGSESGFVQHNTSVTIKGSSTIGVDGTAETDGNVFGGGLGLDNFAEAGRASGNTTVNVNGGTVNRNVYGGGSLGPVGNYYFVENEETHSKTYTWTEGGTCNVTIDALDNNTTTIKGNVFGAGKGSAAKYECEPAMALQSNVTINNGTVNGTVYGGGEIGRVDKNTMVTIGKAGDDSSKPDIKGDVFGAGAGKDTHGYSALVRGNSTVSVQSYAKIGHNVYGGGKTASVGRFVVDAVTSLPKQPVSGGICTVNILGNASIGYDGGNVYGACKGVEPGDWSSLPGHVTAQSDDPTPFTSEADYTKFLKTLALTSNTEVTIGGNSTVNGSVYGGGQRGVTLAGVKVNMTGGTVTNDVYGGGALADTNTENWDDTNNTLTSYHEETRVTRPSYQVKAVEENASVEGLYIKENNEYTAASGTADSGTTYYEQIPGSSVAGYYTKSGSDEYTLLTSGIADESTTYYRLTNTTVNLLGGTIRNAYGGGLGSVGTTTPAVLYTAEEAAAYNTEHNLSQGDEGYVTEGDVKTPAVTGVGAVAASVYGDVLVELNKDVTANGCQVNQVFGCNNVNGTPKGHVKVHIYNTFGGSEKNTSLKVAQRGASPYKYDVEAVFGGGNQADYRPVDKNEFTEVIIEGCDKTSIKDVFGGGNAAATSANELKINGCYIIDNVFGGGNGTISPANVGYNETNYVTLGTAKTNLSGGYIHNVYGGSNNAGNILGGSSVTNDKYTGEGCCDVLQVLEVFGGGREAEMFGGTEIVLGCMPNDWIGAIYAGAESANVGNDVSLTLTSGKFGRVFGGNKSGGEIDGYIEVNIEENPDCDTPIIIGELYGGGNEAPYTTPASYGADYPSPRVNVRAFTSIGTIYGGGFGASATVTGNPSVNINEVAGGKEYDGQSDSGVRTEKVDNEVVKIYKTLTNGTDETEVTLYPRVASGTMGVIGNVFGGGNAAEVIGNTNVNIGTTKFEQLTVPVGKNVKGYYSLSGEGTEGNPYVYNEITTDTEATANTIYFKKVLGADIRGNVYGAGNNAPVTGDTNVIVGRKATTSSGSGGESGGESGGDTGGGSGG